MKRIIFAKLLSVMMLSATMLSACDDGLIYPETGKASEGKSVTIEGRVSGLDTWPDSYRISVAGFESAADEYANISKVVTASDIKDGMLSVELSGLDSKVKLVRLCVLDRLRRHILSFKEIDVSASDKPQSIDLGTVDIGMYSAIQHHFFDKRCTSCHGGANRVAAGLYLTEDKSYEALVGKPSKKVEGYQLVEINNAAASVLHMVINQETVDGISMSHRDIIQKEDEQTMLPLIDAWINNGAPGQ